MPSGYAAQNFREKRREVAPPQVAPRVILSEVELWRLAHKARDVPSMRNLRGLLRMTRNRIVWQYSVRKHLMDISKMSSFRINIVGATIGRPRWQTVRGTVWRSTLLSRRGDSRIARRNGASDLQTRLAAAENQKRFQYQIRLPFNGRDYLFFEKLIIAFF